MRRVKQVYGVRKPLTIPVAGAVRKDTYGSRLQHGHGAALGALAMRDFSLLEGWDQRTGAVRVFPMTSVVDRSHPQTRNLGPSLGDRQLLLFGS